MVRNTYNKTKIFGSLTLAGTLTLIAFNHLQPAFAESGSFTATVDEMLTVTLDTGSTQATGTPSASGTLLNTKVGLSVATNNASGFSASIVAGDSTTYNTTSLVNSASTVNNEISALATNASYSTSNFPTNYWGFAVLENNGSGTSYTNGTYKGIAKYNATPSYVASATAPANGGLSKNYDLHFVAKADTTKASGSYKNNVVISVVSGTVTTTPTTPTDPVKPSTDPTPNDGDGNPGNNGGTYTSTLGGTGSQAGSTVTRVTSGTTTTTQVSSNTSGTTKSSDTRQSYSKPQGVTNTTTTTATINEGTPLATGLAVTAGVAAVAGVAFFVVAKKKQNEEDDEEF